MANDHFELMSYDGKSFRGISKSDSVFIDFTQMRKNQGFVEIMGPKGAKKSSTLWGIAYNMGAELGIDKKRLFNSIDNDLEESITGKKNGEEYKVEIAPSRLTVRKKVGGDKWKEDDEDTPTALVKKLFGTVGVFPDIQSLKGKKQIEYFIDTFAPGSGAGKKMEKLEAEYDKKFQERRDINRDATLLKGALEVEPLYQNYEASTKRFAKPISAEKEEKAFKEIVEKKKSYDKYKEGLDKLEEAASDLGDEIAQLEKRLAAARSEKKDLDDRVVKGKKWMKDNEAIVKQHEAAEKEWMSLSKTLTDYDKWNGLLKKEKQFIELQEKSTLLTAELDELNEKILKTAKDCLPKIPGLSVKIATGIDKTKVQEGVYYQVPGKKVEQPIHELSETENADMWCLIWMKEGTQFVFIENMPNFGDSMVKTLEQFTKNGGVVFYTQQNRKQKDLSITFKSKID